MGALLPDALCGTASRMYEKPGSQINVRVDAELRQQLERLARAEDRPLSSLVRRVLRREAAVLAGRPDGAL
jgi:predicted HicB family RNase H-like nuclease